MPAKLPSNRPPIEPVAYPLKEVFKALSVGEVKGRALVKSGIIPTIDLDGVQRVPAGFLDRVRTAVK